MVESEHEIYDDSITGGTSEIFQYPDEKQQAAEQEFSPEEMRLIESRRRILSSLAYFIGKDFQMPVELNQPGAGWHWDFKENVVRVDPKDLLEKPMEYLRFVISHEGGHRRISRTEFIPLETWRQPGFSFLMNAIEDPRDNNFVAENYPKFREQMGLAYDMDLDLEGKLNEKAKAKLGYQPRFMQAGFEYIKQWFREQRGEEFAVDESLPEEVKEVVAATLDSAKVSWWTYPSRQEADESEVLITRYAQASYKINLEKVWPEFQKLVEKDLEDQQTQELLDDLQKDKAEGSGPSLPQELKDKLTPEEQKEIEDAIDKAIDEAKKELEEKSKSKEDSSPESGEGAGKPQEPAQEQSPASEGKPKPIDLNSLSEELKQKIKDFIDSLPPEKREKLKVKAQKTMAEFEKDLDEEIGGKMSDDPEKKAERDAEEAPAIPPEAIQQPQPAMPGLRQPELEEYKKIVEEALKKDENIYEEYRREVLEVIDSLESDLREIFVARRAHAWRSGFKAGKRIDIKRRIQEKAKDISAIESKSWEKRELPSEKDYAISLLVDLSGSMSGEKIEETFKAVIVLAEVLNRLSIQTEILGFNDRIYEYQLFGQDISKETREKMGGMLGEVEDRSDTGKARWNDDGWALEQTSERLAAQKAEEKFLVVLSDGVPEESPMHPRSEYDLRSIIEHISRETDQKLIGLGIGSGTEHVDSFYPNSLANVGLEEMAEKLADLIREVIANYDKF